MSNYKNKILLIMVTSYLFGCGSEVNEPPQITEEEATRTFMAGYAQHTLRRIADAELAGDDSRRKALTAEAQSISGSVKASDCRLVEYESNTFSACVITATSADGESINLKTLFRRDSQSDRWILLAANT